MTSSTLRAKIVRDLKKLNKPYEIQTYFWDKRGKKEEIAQEFDAV